MHYQLEHVAIHCRDLNESIKFYEKFFGGSPTAIRRGTAGYGFCFMRIDGAPSIQLMESSGQVGVHHYGFVTDDIDQVAKDFKEKGAASIDERAFHVIEADAGIRHGMAARVTIAGLRDYAARAGWTDRNTGDAWIREAETMFKLRGRPDI